MLDCLGQCTAGCCVRARATDRRQRLSKMSQETQYTTTIVDVRCGVKSSNAGVCCVDEFRVCGNSRLSRVCVGVCCIVYKTMTAMLVLPAALTAGPSLCLILCCLSLLRGSPRTFHNHGRPCALSSTTIGFCCKHCVSTYSTYSILLMYLRVHHLLCGGKKTRGEKNTVLHFCYAAPCIPRPKPGPGR